MLADLEGTPTAPLCKPALEASLQQLRDEHKGRQGTGAKLDAAEARLRALKQAKDSARQAVVQAAATLASAKQGGGRTGGQSRARQAPCSLCSYFHLSCAQECCHCAQGGSYTGTTTLEGLRHETGALRSHYGCLDSPAPCRDTRGCYGTAQKRYGGCRYAWFSRCYSSWRPCFAWASHRTCTPCLGGCAASRACPAGSTGAPCCSSAPSCARPHTARHTRLVFRGWPPAQSLAGSGCRQKGLNSILAPLAFLSMR